MRASTPATRLLLPILLAILLGLGGCAGTPAPGLVAETGASLGRLRDRIDKAVRLTPGPMQSLSPTKMFGQLRESVAAIPDTFRFHTTLLPDASDFGRLLAPPDAGWRPTTLSERFVSRYRF